MHTGKTRVRAAVCGAVATLLLSAVAEAQVASALLRENDELLAGETISALSNTAVNHVGGFACSLSTVGTGTISRIWGNASGGPGALMRSEATFGTLQQNSFESFYGMSDTGQLVYSAISEDTKSGATGLDGVWRDDVPVLNELDPVHSLPGQFSSFNSRPGVTGDGVPWWVGGITSSQGGTTQNRVLFSGLSADVIVMGGDFIPGIPDPIKTASGGIDFDFRVSRFGTNWINLLNVDSGTSDDGIIVINGEALFVVGGIVREDSPVPAAVGGLPGELWDNFDYQGINETGDHFFTGDTNAAAASDEFVFKNGQIVLREGTVLDLGGIPVPLAGAIEGGYMNRQGDWAVIWDVDLPVANVEALIANRRILLVEGALVDWNGDGVIDGNDNGGVLENFTGISALTVGARQGSIVRIYFTADIDFGGTLVEGFFCIEFLLADFDGNGSVGAFDLAQLLGSWGPCADCNNCPADFDGDCDVDAANLAFLLGAWG